MFSPRRDTTSRRNASDRTALRIAERTFHLKHENFCATDERNDRVLRGFVVSQHELRCCLPSACIQS